MKLNDGTIIKEGETVLLKVFEANRDPKVRIRATKEQNTIKKKEKTKQN